VRRAILVVLALAVSGVSAGAQTVQPAHTADSAGESGVQFLPRFDFQVSMEHLFSDETRYVWDANFGGDIDLVAIGRSRVTFVANYQTMLGSEFRAFDPNQGNYTLEGSVSTRTAGIEIGGVFHHVSRHLSDRPKRHPVDWNMVGGRIAGSGSHDRVEYQARTDVRGVIQHTFVDYRWELDTEATARVKVLPRVSLTATGAWRVLGVDDSRGRDTQQGYRGEGGVRLAGRDATLDLFVAFEQRIDAYQLEFSTVRWMTAGFRISSPRSSRVP
jgi:hypothetical protein